MLTKKVDGVTVRLTDEEEAAVRAEWAANDAARAQAEAAEEARKAARAAVLADTPANDLSLPALREAINEIKALLRGDS